MKKKHYKKALQIIVHKYLFLTATVTTTTEALYCQATIELYCCGISNLFLVSKLQICTKSRLFRHYVRTKSESKTKNTRQ